MSRVIYTVKPGDTLGKIAQTTLGDRQNWVVLARYNDLDNPNLIEVGQELEIPPWMPHRFQFPLEETETPYYKFGSIYSSGPHAGKPHPGVDFHQVGGARVYAVGDGIVRVRREDPQGYGFYTVIEHRLPGEARVWSLYAHLATPGIHAPGAWVNQGRLIGWEGDTGASRGLPHLHFEVKRTSELGLYGQLSQETLRKFWIDPYFFLANAVFEPVHCWGCPNREQKCS